MRFSIRLQGWILAATLSLPAPAAYAQVYKWVDENGVTNYSNEAPAKPGRKVTVVEDRISVYTPEQSVLDAAQKARERSAAPPPAPMQPGVTIIAPSSASGPAVTGDNDPCRNTNDPNCYSVPFYGTPVVISPRRAQQLNQPQLTPGAIAGNVTGGSGYTVGLSGQTTPPAALTTTRPPAASFTVRPRPDDYRGDRGWR